MQFLGGRLNLTTAYGNSALDKLEEIWEIVRQHAEASDESEDLPQLPEWVLENWWQALKDECLFFYTGEQMPELTRRPEMDTDCVFVFTFDANDACVGESAAHMLEACLMLIHIVEERAVPPEIQAKTTRPVPVSNIGYTMFDYHTYQGHNSSELINAYTNVFDHNYDI